MTTVTTLAQSLSAHPGPWNGGYGWFPFFPLFGFFFFALLLFLVFGVFGRRRGWGGPPHRDPVQSAEAEGRISRFRAETREQRIAIAQEAQGRYQRTVSWGARVGDTTALFTHLAVPVMTRLRQPERAVLDTLVDAGVARSRSDALAWSVRVVGEHADTWLAELRDKMAEVDKLRAKGPEL